MAHCNTSNTITKTHSNRLSLFTCIAHGPLTDWKYNIINFIIQLEVNEKDLEGFFIIMAMIWMSFLKRRSLGQEYNAVSDLPQTILSFLNYWFKKLIINLVWILTSDLVNTHYDIMLFRWLVRVTDTLSRLHFWSTYWTCANQ